MHLKEDVCRTDIGRPTKLLHIAIVISTLMALHLKFL